MESSKFYELQQQQLATYSSFAAPQSATTTGIAPPIHHWNPSLPLNNDEYEHYMNEILPMSAQLMKNDINFECDDEYVQRCSNPCTNSLEQNTVVDLNQNLWLTTSSAAAASFSPSANINYALDSVITSSSNSNFMTNYLNNGENISFAWHDPIRHQDSSYGESSSSNKTSACKDKAISQTKRVCSSYQNDAAAKKQKAASQSSYAKILKCKKVVKEKIGDRIAALHRLVGPFGKTDAASVLTEAIGYIQFLHHQIQTLSMSCIKPSQSNRHHCFQRVSGKQKGKECWDANEDDLRSRGLSLVPISVAAYVSSSSVGLD